MIDTSQSHPFVIPPKENKEAAIVFREFDRKKNELVVMRKQTHDLKDDMPGAWQDAWMEIALTAIIYGKYGNTNYRQMSWGRVGGMTPAELSNYFLDVKKRHKEWRAHMIASGDVHKLSMVVCECVCRREDPLSKIRTEQGIGYKRARQGLEFGLSEYARLAGWK